MTMLQKELQKRILLLDGAMGTAIQKYNLEERDFLYQKGCLEILNVTRPDVIQEIHRNYIKAGADIIETNSFHSNRISLAEYDLSDKAYEFSKASALLAQKVVAEYQELTSKKIWIAGSVGPTNKRGLSFDLLKEAYYEQIHALMDGGIDIVLIETILDGANAKAALTAAEEVFESKNKILPVMISATVNKQGTLLSGESMESLIASLDRSCVISFGFNCSFGAKHLLPLIRNIRKFTSKYISLYPNAGLPDKNGVYEETHEITVGYFKELVEEKSVNILGGCCGTHFAYIEAISKLLAGEESSKTKNCTSNLDI